MVSYMPKKIDNSYSSFLPCFPCYASNKGVSSCGNSLWNCVKNIFYKIAEVFCCYKPRKKLSLKVSSSSSSDSSIKSSTSPTKKKIKYFNPDLQAEKKQEKFLNNFFLKNSSFNPKGLAFNKLDDKSQFFLKEQIKLTKFLLAPFKDTGAKKRKLSDSRLENAQFCCFKMLQSNIPIKQKEENLKKYINKGVKISEGILQAALVSNLSNETISILLSFCDKKSMNKPYPLRTSSTPLQYCFSLLERLQKKNSSEEDLSNLISNIEILSKKGASINLNFSPVRQLLKRDLLSEPLSNKIASVFLTNVKRAQPDQDTMLLLDEIIGEEADYSPLFIAELKKLRLQHSTIYFSSNSPEKPESWNLLSENPSLWEPAARFYLNQAREKSIPEDHLTALERSFNSKPSEAGGGLVLHCLMDQAEVKMNLLLENLQSDREGLVEAYQNLLNLVKKFQASGSDIHTPSLLLDESGKALTVSKRLEGLLAKIPK